MKSNTMTKLSLCCLGAHFGEKKWANLELRTPDKTGCWRLRTATFHAILIRVPINAQVGTRLILARLNRVA